MSSYVLVEGRYDHWIVFERDSKRIVSITNGRPNYIMYGTQVITYAQWSTHYDSARSLATNDFKFTNGVRTY